MYTVRQIERLPTSSGDVPKSPVVITESGVLEATDPFLTQENTPADGDKYEDFPEDGDDDVQNPEIALAIAREIRELGNKLFKEGNARDALLKYQSTYPWSVLAVPQLLNTFRINPIPRRSPRLAGRLPRLFARIIQCLVDTAAAEHRACCA